MLPTIAPDLRYDQLDEVQDGGMAMQAYLEAVDPATQPERRDQLQLHLLAYCQPDTFAMVRLCQHFTGRKASPAP